MLALGENNLYDYRLQTLTDVQGVLSKLLAAKEQMLSQNNEVINKIYTSFESIQKVLNEKTPSTPLQAWNESMIGFLDKDLMEIFLNDPTDVEMRYALSLELKFIEAATNTGTTPVNPYTEEEMSLILKGKGDAFYDDFLFVFTLRQLLEANVSGTIFSLLVKTFRPIEENSDNTRSLYWNDAFVFSAVLHSIWRHFFLLSEVEQQFILQNYFYQSIVLGVPVRFALRETLIRASVKGKTEKTLQSFRESISVGKETIPTNILTAQGKTVGAVMREFVTKMATEQINTLVQEKYISEVYRGQQDNEFFAAWLRETLTTIAQLKSGEILK